MPDTSADAPRKMPSRRAVLKTGAHAAWAVPAIQIAAATPAFAASGVPTTYPTSKLGASIVGWTRRSDNTGYVVVQVTATAAAAKNVVVTLSGFDRSSTASSSPVPVPLATKVAVTIPVTFRNGTRTVTAAVTGDTDNPGGARAAGTSTSATIPSGSSSGTRAATLSLSTVRAQRGYTWDWASFSFKPTGSVALDFTIGTDLAVKSVAWSLVATGTGTLLASGTTANLGASGSRALSTTYSSAPNTAVTLTATAVTDAAGDVPAVRATSSFTA